MYIRESRLGVPLITNPGTITTSPLATSAILSPLAQRGIPTSTIQTNAIQGQIRGESRVEYVPYQKKIIEYEAVERVEYIPYEKKVIQYQQRKRVEQVPVQRTYTDYYAIQHITQYVPQVIPQTKIQYVPVERFENRIQYYPVQKQVIHYPDQLTRSGYRPGTHSGYASYQTSGTIPTQQVYSSAYGIGPTTSLGINQGYTTSTYGASLNSPTNGGRLLGGQVNYPNLSKQYTFGSNIGQTAKFGSPRNIYPPY